MERVRRGKAELTRRKGIELRGIKHKELRSRRRERDEE